jgi:acyl-coenzyme A thioesterase PaaI-like protein
VSAGPWNPGALRRRLNAYPPYSGARIEVTHVAADASEIRVRMPLEQSNVNLVGTHFGGSLYAMVDPHLMILLIQRLGPEYVVWDRAATIDFLRPGRGTVHATIAVDDAELDAIRAATASGEKHLPQWTLRIMDDEGEVVATVLKTLYVRRKRGGADQLLATEEIEP